MNKTYTDGINDIWKLLKVFNDMEVGKRQEVFCGGYTLEKLLAIPPEILLENLECYEKKEAEIHVGDVVEWNGIKAVVMDDDGNGSIAVFTEEGNIKWSIKDFWKKTNEKINIAPWLIEKLKGE